MNDEAVRFGYGKGNCDVELYSIQWRRCRQCAVGVVDLGGGRLCVVHRHLIYFSSVFNLLFKIHDDDGDNYDNRFYWVLLRYCDDVNFAAYR